VDGSSPVSPQAGELVITEINAAAQAGRQWFEVFNASTRPLELLGLTVAWRNDIDGAETAGSIVGGVTTVQPGSFRVIGFHEALTSNTSITDVALIDAPLFEVSPGVFVGGMHAAGYLTVLNGTQLIDTVKWTTSEFAASENMKARQLDPDAFTAALNDHVNVPGETNACATPDPLFGQCVWCPATMTYSADGGSAYGTPTGENTQCPGVGPTP
jgi:hypothetical protein